MPVTSQPTICAACALGRGKHEFWCPVEKLEALKEDGRRRAHRDDFLAV